MRAIFPNKSNNCLNNHALLKILVFQPKNVHVFQTVTEVSLKKKVCLVPKISAMVTIFLSDMPRTSFNIDQCKWHACDFVRTRSA